MRVFAGGLALLAPGLDGWAASLPVLAGREPYLPRPLNLPAPASLPANERRRTSAVVRLAMAAAEAAVAASGEAGNRLASVFASSNGDGAVVGAILEALASLQPAVSPTQFHNSVHNAPAGYWGIGAGSMAGSTSFGCHDDTLATALLQAAAKVAATGEPVLLCVYDLPLPEPLAAVRPTTLPFALAMVLTPAPTPASLAGLELAFQAEPPPLPPEPAQDSLRPLYAANAAARSLRLFELLARGEAGPVCLPYLGDSHLRLDVSPC